jgi:histidinol-phosphate aminotransferase
MTYQRRPVTAHALRLHFNENTAGCSPAVHAAVRALSRETMAIYPDYAAITERLERWFGVEPGRVQITNGLDEGIQMVGQYGVCHLDSLGGASGKAPEVIIVDPTFEVYEACADALAAHLVRIPPEPDFRFPLEPLLAAITERTRVIYLTDPNNPTGLGIPAGAIEAIAAAAAHALVLVDEAYADFSGRTFIGPLLDRHRNLVIGRTFAKAHGLAALRAGALIAHPATLDRLRRMQLPFSVNISAVAALDAALSDRKYLEWYVTESAASREAIYDFCRGHDVKYWPSEANFVLIRLGADVSRIVAELRDRQILVRDKSAAPGCAGCVRLTAGVLDHTRRALALLEEILASRAC